MNRKQGVISFLLDINYQNQFPYWSFDKEKVRISTKKIRFTILKSIPIDTQNERILDLLYCMNDFSYFHDANTNVEV